MRTFLIGIHLLLATPLLTASCADARTTPSTRAGMGALVHATGATFRVWAPNADRVLVELKSPRSQWKAFELANESNGNFSADVRGAKPGQEYRYVIETDGKRITRPDPRALRMTHSSGNSVIVDPAAYRWKTRGYKTPAAREQVIYELHVGSFAPSRPGRPGTWKEARAKLPALAELGINMIEVMPPAEFAGDSSWGYNTAYPFAPESAYGTPEDLKSFIDVAHALGIGVIIDVVHNHWGPGDLGMWSFDGESFGGGGIYFYTDWRRETPWGPRPDYGRAEVRDFIVDNGKMWLETYQADGLRWDSTQNITALEDSPFPRDGPSSSASTARSPARCHGKP